MADLSNVIDVAVLAEGTAIQRDNPNVCMIMTSDTGFLNSARRTATYTRAQDVATDFGTTSKAYQHALKFFPQEPNPIDADGKLIIGHWRAADEVVADSAGVLTGAQLVEAVVIPQLQAISDGSFAYDLDGTGTTEDSLDFRTVTNMAGVVTLLNNAITGATVTFTNLRLVITSDTTGASSEVSLVAAHTAGTFVGEILGLAAGTGAVSVDGVAGTTLTAETKLDALAVLRGQVAFRGLSVADAVTDAEATQIATWSEANDVMVYNVFSGATYLQVATSNPVWTIKLASQNNFRCLYRKDNDRTFATAYMARNHVVNFAAPNTAQTMNLKELSGIVAESFTQTEIDQAQTVGLDIYVTFKNVPKLLTSGANDFSDNPYNLLAFIDAMQSDLFNTLGTTPTKIAQTTAGVQQLVNQAEATTRQFVNAGVFAPGTWTSSDRFGDVDTFNRAIENEGFYVLAGSLADQSSADRQARKSPPISVAVKLAGAVHSVSVVLRFNF